MKPSRTRPASGSGLLAAAAAGLASLAFGFVTAMSLDSFLPPHVVINENQGALIDWVDILGPLPRAKQFGGRTRAQSC